MNADRAPRGTAADGPTADSPTDTDGPAGDGSDAGTGTVAGDRAAFSRIRHDVNNSLAAIGAVARLLHTDPELPSSLHRQAALLVDESDRLRRLVDELGRSAAAGGGAGGSAQRRPGSDSRPPSATATTPTDGPTAAPMAAARVLVIDDEEAIRTVLGRVLTRAGYDPILVASGGEALQVIASDPPDAVLCDQRMSGMSGVELHAEAVAIAPNLARRFAFMTGDAEDSALLDAARSGATVIEKPFDVVTLPAIVESLLARPSD